MMEIIDRKARSRSLALWLFEDTYYASLFRFGWSGESVPWNIFLGSSGMVTSHSQAGPYIVIQPFASPLARMA